MAVSFELPQELEKTLREKLQDLDQAAKEALVVDLYRQGKLTEADVSQALGTAWRASQEKTGNKSGGYADSVPAQRLAAWDAWVSKMRQWGKENLLPGHRIDDSRESIYEGRGE